MYTFLCYKGIIASVHLKLTFFFSPFFPYTSKTKLKSSKIIFVNTYINVIKCISPWGFKGPFYISSIKWHPRSCSNCAELISSKNKFSHTHTAYINVCMYIYEYIKMCCFGISAEGVVFFWPIGQLLIRPGIR